MKNVYYWFYSDKRITSHKCNLNYSDGEEFHLRALLNEVQAYISLTMNESYE